MAGWQDIIAFGGTDTTNELNVDLTIVALLTVVGSGEITKLRWWQNTAGISGNCKQSLYNDASPRVLLASAPAVSINVASPGYVEATLSSPVPVTDGQIVGIAINNDTDGGFDARYLNASGTANFKFESYAGSPSTPWTKDGDLTRTYAAGAYLEEAGGVRRFLLVR